MANEFQLYVKNTSNCEGLPLQSFEQLSEKYINDSVVIPFGEDERRILDDQAEPIEGVDDHLPPGYGRPLIWIEDLTDLPDAVQKVVTIPICQGCGRPLPRSTSPYHAGGKGEGVYLCPDCADPQTEIDYLARAKADLAALERGELATLVGWGVKDLREVGSGDVDSNQ